MKHRPLRHRLEYAAYLALSRVLMALPHRAVRSLGHGLGALGHAMDRRHRTLALRNLALTLTELDETDRRRIVAACYRHFGAAFCEPLSACRFSASELGRHFHVEGYQHLDDALAYGRGALIICGHFGSWQTAIYPLASALGTLYVVARPPDNPFVAHDLRRLRERRGAVVLDRSGVGHRVVNLLRRGEVVGMVVDQRPPPGTGIVVPFLGRPARSTEVPAFIATRLGTPAVPMTCWPHDDGTYTVRLDPPIAAAGRGPEAVERLTRAYLATVERDIRRQPELWLWMHDRWKA